MTKPSSDATSPDLQILQQVNFSFARQGLTALLGVESN